MIILALAVNFLRSFLAKPEMSIQDNRANESKPLLEQLPVVALDSPENLRTALSAMEFDWDASEDVVKRAALVAAIQELLETSYVQKSVDAFKAFRKRTGHVLRSQSEIDADGWSIADSFVFVESFPDGARFAGTPSGDTEKDFDRIWEMSHEAGAGANRPVAIASSADGFVTKVGEMSRADQPRPQLEGRLTMKDWYGGITTGGRRWWKPSRLLKDVLGKGSIVLVAVTGVVLEYADGSRRPLVIMHFFDEESRAWVLQSMTATNYRSDQHVWPPEY